MEANRFRSSVKRLEYFKDIISVKCPNCHKRAELKRQFEYIKSYKDSYKFQCDNCYTIIKEVEKYIYTVNRYCPYCSEKINHRSMPTTKVRNEERIVCKGCNTSICYIPKVEIIYDFIPKGKKVAFFLLVFCYISWKTFLGIE